MGCETVGEISVGVEVAQEFHLSPAGAERSCIGARVEGEVGRDGVELFGQETVGGLVVVVAVDDVLNHVDVVHYDKCFGGGAKAVA